MGNRRTRGIGRQVLIAAALTATLGSNCIAGALDERGVTSGYSTQLPGNKSGLVLTSFSRFETPIKWQSSVNIAGSRAWSKFVKLSPSGINLRLPLN